MKIEELKALEAKASAGPWVWNWSDEMSKYVDCRLMGKHGEVIPIRVDHHEPIWDVDNTEGLVHVEPTKNDRDAIVGFRNSMKALLAIAEAAKRKRDIEKQRDHDEQEHAAAGMTFSVGDLASAEQALEAALALLEDAR